jgi:hypothetical protein
MTTTIGTVPLSWVVEAVVDLAVEVALAVVSEAVPSVEVILAVVVPEAGSNPLFLKPF